jgi:hypothetical protein
MCAMRQVMDAGFSGAGAGQDQDRPADRLDGGSLLGVERVEIKHSGNQGRSQRERGHHPTHGGTETVP